MTAIGAATAIIVGCVAITPAGGYISPGWAMALGALAALPSYAVIVWRPRTRVDETLDVLAAHGIAGLTGILFIGFVAQVAWNGVVRRPLLRQRRASSATRRSRRSPPRPTRSRVTYVLLRADRRWSCRCARPSTRRRSAWTSSHHGEEAYATGEGAILVAPGRRAPTSRSWLAGRI